MFLGKSFRKFNNMDVLIYSEGFSPPNYPMAIYVDFSSFKPFGSLKFNNKDFVLTFH